MRNFKKCLSILLILAMVLPMIYLPPTAHAASASDYISSTYSSNIRVKATQNLELRTLPTTSAGSVTTTVAAGTLLTVQAMYYSTESVYWYKVLYYGKTLYCRSAYTQLADHLTGDITISNVQSPASLEYGTSFPITGDITSTYNLLGKVTAGLYKNTNIHGVPYMSASATVNSKSYSLASSTIDNNMTFGSVARGVYTYAVTVEAISYYYDSTNNKFATSSQTVVVETQQCIVTDWSNPNSSTGWGIDVSVYQGSITWSTTRNYVDFAILRIGYSTTLDTKFIANAKACETYGVPYGIYLYSHATTQSAAIAEANFVISTLKSNGLTPDLQIWYDIEKSSFTSLSTSTKQAIGKGFCDTIAAAGYMPGIYTYSSWFYNYFSTSYFSSIAKWVAQIDGFSSNGTSTYDGGLWLWQYSWTGSVSGISGDVDCDYAYFDFSGGSSDTSYLKNCTYYPVHATGTVNSTVNIRTYPSSSYSASTTYSSGKEVEILGLYKNSAGEYWYQIKYGSSNAYAYASYINIDEFLYDDVGCYGITMTSNLSTGSSYSLSGTVSSQYNRLANVYAKVYSGEDTTATAKISGSDSPNTKEYRLLNSNVDSNLPFGSLSSGYYTYAVSADIKSYYVSGGTLYSTTKNVVVYTAPFTVGGVSITMPDSAACSHTTVSQAAVAATCTASGLTAGSYCSKCGETLVAQTTVAALGHSYSNGVCTRCGITCSHRYSGNTCTVCGMTCQHSYYDGVCSICGQNCPHSYVNGVCANCGTVCTHRYSGSSCTVCGMSCQHTYYSGICSICGQNCPHSYTDGICEVCGQVCAHPSYEDGFCTACGCPDIKYCLFGYINGANYACEEDAENVGEYLFVDGTLTATFTEDSYIAVKSDDNSFWYSTDGDPEAGATSAIFYDSSDLENPGRLFVPGRREVTFYLTVNADDSLTVSYTIAPCSHDWDNGICTICDEVCAHNWSDMECTVCGKAMPIPEIALKNYTVSFDGEVCYNIYFTLSDAEDIPLEDIGLLTWSTAQSAGTIDTAHAVIPGALTDGAQYMVHSNGVPAKQLSDSVYFKIYVKLPDGSYVYSDMKNVNAKSYALGRIANSSDSYMKALCVAMLNYGAAAQTYFGYKSYNLMNSTLTDAQKALIMPYSSSMMDTPLTVDESKVGIFANTGFTTRYATASFDAAFSLNYYLTAGAPPAEDMTLYYWDLETYESVDVLTKENATGSIVMTATGNGYQYWGSVAGIAAKEIDKSVFVAATFKFMGNEFGSGVMSYSMGRYCVKIGSDSTSAQQALAQATAVYGYYAKEYFKNLYG